MPRFCFPNFQTSRLRTLQRVCSGHERGEKEADSKGPGRPRQKNSGGGVFHGQLSGSEHTLRCPVLRIFFSPPSTSNLPTRSKKGTERGTEKEEPAEFAESYSANTHTCHQRVGPVVEAIPARWPRTQSTNQPIPYRHVAQRPRRSSVGKRRRAQRSGRKESPRLRRSPQFPLSTKNITSPCRCSSSRTSATPLS